MAKNGKLSTELAEAFEADVGYGFEEVKSSDLQIPFVRIIQALSPQLKKSDPAYLDGSVQGDIFNTVTGMVWGADEGVLVIPVHFAQKLLEFVPRAAGGGFLGELSPESADVRTAVRDKDTGMELLINGNELVRTAQHYVKIVHEDGSLENAIVDMKKTQLKKSRLWLAMMMMQKHNGKTLPSFANTYRLKSVEDGNDKGSWHSWSVALGKRIHSMAAYEECTNLHSSIRKGELQIAPPVDATAVQSFEDEVPF